MMFSQGVRHGLLDGSRLPLRVVPDRLMMGGRASAIAEYPSVFDLKFPAGHNTGEGPLRGAGSAVLAGNYSHPLGAIDGDTHTGGSERGIPPIWLPPHSCAAHMPTEAEEDEEAIKEEEGGGWQHVLHKAQAGHVYVAWVDVNEPGAADAWGAPDYVPSFVICVEEDALLFRTHTLVGVVSEGRDVVRLMSSMALDEEEAPVTPNHVISARASLLRASDLKEVEEHMLGMPEE
jgi:hypothetical protein